MASKKNELGALGRAASGERGQAASRAIADQVVNRIVENSSTEFRDFLNRQGGGNANAAVTQAVGGMPSIPAPPPQPVLGVTPQASMPAAPQPIPPWGAPVAIPPRPALSPYGDDPRAQFLQAMGLI